MIEMLGRLLLFKHNRLLHFALATAWCLSINSPQPSLAQEQYDLPPINYSESKPTDKVNDLIEKLIEKSETLDWEPEHGYLESLLKKLEIPVSSQALVFSKTSLQIDRIGPQRPRAVYFNDDIYVGWVQNGDVIEVSAADPKLGATFYSLAQRKLKLPQFKRETSRCLQCHGATHTRGRPGHIVRSVYPNESGMPEFGLGTHLISPLSKFEHRFGGWYVSGTHGKGRHLGNSWLPESENAGFKRLERRPSELDTLKSANLKTLDRLFDTSPYLTNHSDIVAQLVLQHQVHMHNILTEANYSGRQAAHDAVVMNEIFERDKDYESDTTRRRYDSAAEKVVKGLLFCDEVPLPDSIAGTSGFEKNFESLGPFDSANRSLRHFDLKTRIFKYPCSFLIYSESFKQLPDGVLTRAKERLNEVLTGKDNSEAFQHLDQDTRQTIKEILDETLSEQ